MLAFAIVVLLWTMCDGQEELKFSYKKSSVGPRQWGCLSRNWTACRGGRMQSPVALKTKDANDDCELGLLEANFTQSNGTLVASKYLYKIVLNPGSQNMLLVVDTYYSLVQFHFHHPSEHTIDGKRFALEMHLVYQAVNMPSMLLVVAQMFKPGKSNLLISQCTSSNKTVDLHKLKLGTDYLTYKGSLTTPPCTENVTWIVMSETKSASKEQIKYIKQQLRGGNARPLQRLNHRKVQLFSY